MHDWLKEEEVWREQMKEGRNFSNFFYTMQPPVMSSFNQNTVFLSFSSSFWYSLPGGEMFHHSFKIKQ